MDIYASRLLDESNFPFDHGELIGTAATGLPYGTEIGSAADGRPYLTEIGTLADGDPFGAEIGTLADGNPYGAEIGSAADGLPFQVEIGAEEAIRRVLVKARDNRQPAPTMRAVDLDAPLRDEGGEWLLTDVFLGAAEQTGSPNPFPLTASLMQRFGAGGEPRIVQVDTVQSHELFRAQNSPEMAQLLARVADLESRFAQHATDPDAHARLHREYEEVSLLGAVVEDAELQKRVAAWLPPRFSGKWDAWLEGDKIFACIKLPDGRGQPRVITSMEPAEKGIAEMARHASEAGVPAAAITPVLPAMGVVLGAANVMKDLVAGAKSLLRREEMKYPHPFQVRLEPKGSPALCALLALCQMCHRGDAQACEEWQRLAASGAPPVRQMMGEASALLKRATARA